VFVSGRAGGAFTLEYGVGAAPQQWMPVGQGNLPVSNGLLGIWTTAGLAPGEYSLRLRVVSPEGIQANEQIVVRVER
jgi:hypothetical protein